MTRAAPRMAAQDALAGQPQSIKDAMPRNRLMGIMRATRLETAGTGQKRRDAILVKADGNYHEQAHHRLSFWRLRVLTPSVIHLIGEAL